MQLQCRSIIAIAALLASFAATAFADDAGQGRISVGSSLPAPHEIESLPSRSVAELLRREASTGTLLFTEGDCLAVKVFSQSPYTHVAAIVEEQDGAAVYESQNGVGVRRLSLEKYVAMQEGCEVGICYPQEAMNADQEQAFIRHLDSQLGRPYVVRHHLTGNRAAGIHCAEYMTDAFAAAGLLHAERPPKVSPASLRQGVLMSRLHREGRRIFISDLEPEPVEGRNWCEDMWLDTVRCTSDTWNSFRRCVLCR